ncbi:hypothetical protein BDI4_800027 [Burkholderia diffusa]|nr:hypothetical protein BDI4_800027 [Burkholderia diffusa]
MRHLSPRCEETPVLVVLDAVRNHDKTIISRQRNNHATCVIGRYGFDVDRLLRYEYLVQMRGRTVRLLIRSSQILARRDDNLIALELPVALHMERPCAIFALSASNGVAALRTKLHGEHVSRVAYPT